MCAGLAVVDDVVDHDYVAVTAEDLFLDFEGFVSQLASEGTLF